MPILQPQSIPGGITYGDILNQWDAMKPDIASTLYFPYGDEYARLLSSLQNTFGQKREIYAPITSWFERDRMVVSFTVDNGPVTSHSGFYSVDIPADEVDPTTGYSYPDETDIWQHIPSGENFYIVDKPDQNTLLLKQVRSSASVTLQDGDKFIYINQTSPESSGPPNPKYYFATQYDVRTKIARHSKQSSGSALYNEMWIKQRQDGVETPFSNSLDVIDLQHEGAYAMIMGFFASEVSDTLSSDYTFIPSGTESMYDGLLPTIMERGQIEGTGGTPDVTDLYALEAALSSQDAAVRNYAVLMSGRMYGQMSTTLLEYMKQTGIIASREELVEAFAWEGASTPAMKTTLDFQALTFNGKNFAFSRLGIFDNPEGFGAMDQDNNPWLNYAFFLPIGNDANAGTRDNRDIGKYIRLVHKKNRFMRMTYTGMMADTNRTRIDELAIDLLNDYAWQFIMANKFGLLYNENL